MYQGSCLLAKVSDLCYSHLRRAKGKLIPEAMQIPSDIQANHDISKSEMHDQVVRLEKFVTALTLGGDREAETELLEHFYEVLQDHTRPVVISIIHAAQAQGPTIAALRAAVIKHMPLDPVRSDASAHLTTAPPPEPSLMERTCTAMMSFLSASASKPAESGGVARGRTFTAEQQTAYIERLKAQTKAKDQTIKSLQQALSSQQVATGRGDTRRGGRGLGRGRGRGRDGNGGENQPEADLMERPECIEQAIRVRRSGSATLRRT